MKENLVRLAVYGTLKSTHANHEILGPDAKVVARGIRVPDMSMFKIGWYPGARRGGNGIEVELVDVPAYRLPLLDQYEGFDDEQLETSLFTREIVTLANGDEVLMYLFNRDPTLVPGSALIPSGRWEDQQQEKNSGS